jgi:xylose isomerase
MTGDVSLAELERRVTGGEIDPHPVSGRQELLENLVNQQIWAAGRLARVDALTRG